MADLPKDVDVRASIVRALEADLVGPFYPPGHAGPTDEVLKLSPSRWYLTGFLAPERAREESDPTAADELDAVVDDDEDPAGVEPQAKQPPRFPASIGLSVLLPPGDARERVTVAVRFAEYVPEAREGADGGRPTTVWRRVPRSPAPLELALEPEVIARGSMVEACPGIWVKGSLALAEAPGLEPGTRALSLFLVNQRHVEVDRPGPRDAQFMFQVEMELAYARGFVARPNRQGEGSDDWDDRVADLQYRNHAEHAVGHGVSATVLETNEAGRASRVRTCWLPMHEVARVRTHEDASVLTSMEKLAALETGADAARALSALVEHYGSWLADQAAVSVDSAEREATKKELLHRAELARKRIRAGIERLGRDPEVFLAFKLMNEAMAVSALRRSPHRYDEAVRPSWRMFQLAFVLLNILGIADEENEHERNVVELIFFPTGGGKTEAYLGVIAFTLLLRRLRGRARPDRGLGVAVLLRYTLRLLTLDQLRW